MRIDFEEKDDYIFCTARCFNFACLQNRDTSRHDCDNGCQQTSNTGKCKNFKGIKTEEPQIKYEIFKPFSIIDIYEKAPCSGEYSALLRSHQNRKIEAAWSEFASIKQSKVLMRNLDWLEKNGFITKKKEVWVNVYLDRGNNEPYLGADVFDSEQEALKTANRIVSPTSNKHVGAVLKD